jgi:GntR family transcriptional regulator, transcriptional repressor for pyruvate dehydrogenase complex
MDTVERRASYELVVEQVRRAVQLGRFGPGDKLPPERELAQQLGVSRTTVREAIRVLQGEGLLEILRGRNGGAMMVAPAVSPQEIEMRLRGRLAELKSVADFRMIVEPAAAKLAAERRRTADLKALRALLTSLQELADRADEEPGPSRFFGVDSEFHHRIAETSRNDMLVAAVDEARARLFTPIGAIFISLHPDANTLHREIFEAIDAQEPEIAESTMRQHVSLTLDALYELAGKKRPT